MSSRRRDREKLRVVVADDQEVVRAGLVMILDAQPGIDGPVNPRLR